MDIDQYSSKVDTSSVVIIYLYCYGYEQMFITSQEIIKWPWLSLETVA